MSSAKAAPAFLRRVWKRVGSSRGTLLLEQGEIPDTRGCQVRFPLRPPASHAAIAMLETAGWKVADEQAKRALRQARNVLHRAGIEIIDASTHELVASVEAGIARAAALTADISIWEGRWPLNTYSRDLGRDGLSAAALDRLATAERMTLEEYQALTAERRRIRDSYSKLQKDCDLCIALAAPGAAPRGLESTGDPVFAAPASLDRRAGSVAAGAPVRRTTPRPANHRIHRCRCSHVWRGRSDTSPLLRSPVKGATLRQLQG